MQEGKNSQKEKITIIRENILLRTLLEPVERSSYSFRARVRNTGIIAPSERKVFNTSMTSPARSLY